MATIKKYNGSTWENAVVRKFGTATETIQSGDTIYANGQPITTYTLKGNEEHIGTPSPQNPVMPNGTGDKTANLFNTFDIVGQVPSTGNGTLVSYNGSTTSFIPINSGNVVVTKPEGILIYLMLYAANGDYIGYDIANTGTTINGSNISGYENARLARLRIDRTSGLDDIQIMLNAGSTALPYEPYGYKIPISNGQQTTNIYLGSTQTVRQIKKLVLNGLETWNKYNGTDGKSFFYTPLPSLNTSDSPVSTHWQGVYISTNNTLIGVNVSNDNFLRIRPENADTTSKNDFVQYIADQYAAGTPVTVWYVLATAETAAVNEPLMKIGNYADTLSNAAQIPTTEGANTISVDTTVQPSEFSATWTGWHNADVKEWDGSQWS